MIMLVRIIVLILIDYNTTQSNCVKKVILKIINEFVFCNYINYKMSSIQPEKFCRVCLYCFNRDYKKSHMKEGEETMCCKYMDRFLCPCGSNIKNTKSSRKIHNGCNKHTKWIMNGCCR